MSYVIVPTTAENIIGATDAALQKTEGVDSLSLAQFLDITEDSAKNALEMASQLGLIEGRSGSRYKAVHPYASYLVSSDRRAKASILRMVLENYPPYRTFKYRLAVTGLTPEAANQTRAIHNIASHREDLLNTFISLGTYTNSLASEGAGLYKANQDDPSEYLAVVGAAIQERASAELHIRKRLGEETVAELDQAEVIEPLVTAYQRLSQLETDPRAPVVYAGNAVESFLTKIIQAHGLSMRAATGINAKADLLATNNHLTTKHKNMIKYLGHIRNAADHGTDPDPDIGQTWIISKDTAIEFVHVALSSLSAIVNSTHRRFVV